MMLISSGMLLGTISILLAHPIFALGVWSDAEPMVVAMFAAAAFCLAGLALLCLDSKAGLRFVLHPNVLLCGSLGFWSLAVAPLTEFPVQSILGPPQNGQGAFWYVAFAAFIASAMVLRRNTRFLELLIVSTVAVALIAAFLNMSRIEWLYEFGSDYVSFPEVTLLRFNEYQAYYAIGLLCAGAVFIGRKRVFIGGSLGVVGIVVLLVSRNRAAMVAVAATSGLAWLLHFSDYGRRLAVGIDMKSRAAKVTVVVGFILVALGPYLAIRSVNLHAVASSLWSRQILFKAIEPSMFDGIQSLLFGHGWGHYGVSFVRDVSASGISMYRSEWEGLGRDIFHSHNAALEGFFSAGIVGFVLVLAIPAAIVLFAQPRWRVLALCFALAWAVVDAFWFMMPATLAPLSVVVGLLSETSQNPRRQGRISTRFVSIVCGLFAALTAGAAWITFSNAYTMTRFTNCLPGSSLVTTRCAQTVPVAFRGTGVELASMLANATKAAFYDKASLSGSKRDSLRIAVLEAQRRAGAGSILLSMALIDAYSSAAFDIEAQRILLDQDDIARLWPSEIQHLLTRAPSRLDILPTYLNWLVINGRDSESEKMLDFVSQIDSGHPIVQWFKGLLLVADPEPFNKMRGLTLMRQALLGGIERFMPVDPSIRSELESGRLRNK